MSEDGFGQNIEQLNCVNYIICIGKVNAVCRVSNYTLLIPYLTSNTKMVMRKKSPHLTVIVAGPKVTSLLVCKNQSNHFTALDIP